LQELLRAGILPISTVGEPGIQGAGVTGVQGAVAPTAFAATEAGFAGELQIPNGTIFFPSTLSIIVAAGGPPAKTLFSGVTLSGVGAAPN
jgi:hypothetical protein